jgi:hypothetical protein
MKNAYPGLIAAAAAVLALVACSGDKTGDCPTITGVTDASAATIFRTGTPPDPANVVYTVEITAVNGTCDMDKQEHTADSRMVVNFRATRPRSGAEAHYTVPYFVAVTDGRVRMLAKRTYSIQIDFAPGQTTATASDNVGSAHLDVAKGKHPYDYQVLVGLQLTKAELDYNRQGSHYGS